MRRPALGPYLIASALLASVARAQEPVPDLEPKPANPIVAAPPATAPASLAAPKLMAIELGGRLLDDKTRLLSFLGLRPGMAFTEQAQADIGLSLGALGYGLVEQRLEQATGGLKLTLVLEPHRVVRKVRIHGNWQPFGLFDDEILRHLSIRSGTQLPAEDKIPEFLSKEAAKVEKFLETDGYFGSKVRMERTNGPGGDWADIDVYLSVGDWYRLGNVQPKSPLGALNQRELQEAFDHCCFRWGRFYIQRMRDDARELEKTLHERGYPGARVTPEFDFKAHADAQNRRILLPVKVVEKRRVDVKFVGNRSVLDRDLKNALTLYSAGAYDEIELAASARAVQRLYQQRGFFEAKVSFQRRRVFTDEKDAQRGIDEVTFLISEGPELRVRAVDFASESGTSLTFGAEDLRSKAGIETKVFPRLGLIGLGEGGYVTTLQLQQDAERLLDLYRSRGFPEVKVRGEVARDPASFNALGALGAEAAGSNEEKNDLYVRFFIDEGRRELVDRIDIVWKGPHQKTEREILDRMGVATGQPFTPQAFDQALSRVAANYGTIGRPYANVQCKDSWNTAHDRLIARCEIEEGPAVVFGEILVRGNFKTRERVILKDLPFKAGEPFNVAKIEQGERNLQSHLIFNYASVKPVGLKEKRNPLPILVEVQERYLEKLGTVAVAAGVATDRLPYYVYASVGWLWGNVFGFGSQLELRADTGFSADAWGVSLRYTDVRAFGPGWRFDLNAFYRSEVTNRLGVIRTGGGSIAVTRLITEWLRAFLRFDFYAPSVQPPFIRTGGSNDQLTQPDDTYISKITTGVVWDRRVGEDGRPNPLMPYKGWLLSASLGYAIPVRSAEGQFLAVSGQALGLLPFRVRGAEFTLIGNLRFDEGIPLTGVSLPVVERFFAGGDTATRGFDTDTLRSEIVLSDVSPLGDGQAFRVVPHGGNVRVLTTVEFQFPIAKTFLGIGWRWVGSLFWDMGAIIDAPSLVQGNDFKHSIGISLLRILTPVGPLSLEYAYPLTQTLAEERWKTSPWYSHFPGKIHFNWGIPLTRL